MSNKITPIRQQYLEIKRQYPDAILFFRLGDFYETFDEDAKIASRELDIVLTSRNVAKGARVPMAGIPHHAAENYIGRLIEKGYHVAICEQIGEGPVKGLFPREVVRVVTPGTVVEPELLPVDSNNYLVAFVPSADAIGIAYADVSTGEFAATEIKTRDPLNTLRHELTRLRPAEVLHPETLELGDTWDGHATPYPDWRFEFDHCASSIMEHFGTTTLDGFGLDGMDLAVSAAGAVIGYLGETQKAALSLLMGLTTYTLDDFMTLDAATRRNLELTETIRTGGVKGSLLGTIDMTMTPMGRRLLRQWLGKPLLDVESIVERLDQVEALYNDGLWRAEVRQALSQFGDLERLANRIVAGVAGPKDLAATRLLLERIPELLELLEREESTALDSLRASIDPCSDVHQLINEALVDDPPATLSHIGVIRPGYSDQLDSVLDASRGARDWIANLEQTERERTGIKTLKVGYNKVFGYYIEVTKSKTDLVPEEYIRKQTLVQAERYITPEMKEYESLVLSAEERIREIESEVFHDLCREISQHVSRLLSTAKSIARLDVISGLAEVAASKGYVRPNVAEDDVLEIREGRHPVVEEYLPGRQFVPNDSVLESGERVRIITGPNMSGKSTYLRQVALIVLLAQMGSYVPARSAKVGLTDRIFTRIGAQDEIHAGQSTFMVEMVEAANILHHASQRSLLILDEIGRGTSTYDGLSIAWAVVEYIHNNPRMRSRTLFATHYHELTQLSEVLPGVRNYNVAVSEEGGQVVFLHKIVPGGADKSYGIHVAELAGVPRPVLNRAQEILSLLEAEAREMRSRQEITIQQLTFFPEKNPLLDELKELDIDSLAPLEALNKLYEWQQMLRSSLDEEGEEDIEN
ncbi:MAG: DNA mismatch repair protein MutS [Anaerolineales bacterium]|nr:DNA mismatch repair protein MutS [Anaerolineales bacterium]